MKKSDKTEGNSAIWILDNLDSKRKEDPKTMTSQDSDTNLGRRRTFKKQNRSTIVESSNSFSKSRTQKRNSQTDLGPKFKTSGSLSRQTGNNSGKRTDKIKIITEEEEHNF